MERESFVFYRSFAKACKRLSPDIRIKVYDALIDYALDEIDPEEDDGIVLAILDLIKPQVDANNKRRENGKKGAEFGEKGGRPKEETPKKQKNNPKKTPTKPQENPKQTPNVNVNDNVNVNENVNVNVNEYEDIYSTEPETNSVPLAPVEAIPLNDGSEWIPTFDEYEEYKRLFPAVDVDQEFRIMRSWSNSNPTKKKTIRGVRSFVNTWLNKAQNKPRPQNREEKGDWLFT